jgi:hypothetical protein
MTSEKLTKEQKIEELVEYIVEGMDVATLETFVKENLAEYYNSDDGADDFEVNYLEIKNLMGDE